MKQLTRVFALAFAGAAMIDPAAALATERTFRVDANASASYDISVCSSSVYMVANGDDDTDLDFWLYDNNGNLVHSDTDSTDITFYTIQNPAAAGRCLPYRLQVSNLGGVYNNMVLSLTDQESSSVADVQKGGGGGSPSPVSNTSFRIESNSDKDITLTLCAPSVYIEARGDGDTDLDFWIYDDSGNQVHSDTDSTDITFATLYSGRTRGSCVAYRMRVHNFGGVYNQLALTLTEQ